jgi:hypothetical protein
MMKFSMAVVAVLLMVQSVFAQGGPTQAQTASRNAATSASNGCGQSLAGASTAWTQALAVASDVQPAYPSWTQAQKDSYNAMIATALTFLTVGDSYFNNAESAKNTANSENTAGNTAWNMAHFADAAEDYDDATIHYNTAISGYNDAKAYYNEAKDEYQAIINLYNANTPPII